MQLVTESLDKQVYEDLIEVYNKHSLRSHPQQFSELLAKYSWADIGAEATKRLKQQLLDKYSEREPTKFVQIDCWEPNAKGDCIIDEQGTGFGMMSLITHELMNGTPIRILIADDYDDPEILAEMLEKAAEWVRKGAVDSIRTPTKLDDYMPF